MSSSKNDPFRSKRKRSKPIPIWPVVMGPVLGMVGLLVIGMAFRERKAPALTASDHMWKAVSGFGGNESRRCPNFGSACVMIGGMRAKGWHAWPVRCRRRPVQDLREASREQGVRRVVEGDGVAPA